MPERWTATDSLRFETHLGRPSLYVDRGVALATGVSMRDGVYAFDVAATGRSNFAGATFRASAPDHGEIVFFRYGQTGTSQAVQYGPALHSLGSAWQVYHGAGANAVADLERERWMHVRIELRGSVARVFLDGASEPTLTVPRLAGTEGDAVGVWTGLYGRGAYFSEFRWRADDPAPASEGMLAPGTIERWEISPAFDAETFTPDVLPDLSAIVWEPVSAEPPGLVLLNRHRTAPALFVPFDPGTGRVDVDSVMTGRVSGSQVVYARTRIEAAADGPRRMHFGYSDNVVIYANGAPLFFGSNAQFFRGDGFMSEAGDAVYLPLRRGANEIVLAVTEYTGGWAFWARLDPPPR